MLGREVVDVLRAAGQDVTPLTRSHLDVLDGEAAREAVAGHDVLVNCTAWTAVDDAEAHEREAFAVNGLAPALLGAAAQEAGARMVHVSTDYVFSGDAREPYAEDAVPGPRSAYGRTKLAGEWAVAATCPDHLLVRTSWLYGDGACFPRTIARLLSERETITVVEDQWGQPTWTRDVAELVLRLVEAEAPAGTYHATSGGRGTWRDLARAVAGALGADPERVLPTTSVAFVRPAPRPTWSVLGHDRLHAVGVEPVGDWRERWDAAAPRVLRSE